MKKSEPTFMYEEQLWEQGISTIAGIDEVGMGALAGPVVAAAVVFAKDFKAQGIHDSKKLSPKKRLALTAMIKESAVTWAIGEASVAEVDALSIRKASHVAMRRAVDALQIQPDILLIDGLEAQPHPGIPAQAIIKGDSLSLSIAAASILAKVYRDELMDRLHEQHPDYGFNGHKGYGTPLHLTALKTYGVTPQHRVSYAPVAQALQDLT